MTKQPPPRDEKPYLTPDRRRELVRVIAERLFEQAREEARRKRQRGLDS